jgi:hypothetical protein
LRRNTVADLTRRIGYETAPPKGHGMFTLTWLKDALERAAKTFAQSLLSLMTLGTAITDVDWGSALALSGTAAAVSVLTSVVSAGVADKGSASLVDLETPGRHAAHE